MTLYADIDYYNNEFNGSLIPENELEKNLKLAQEKIDSITYNRIVAIGFDNLTNFQQLKVKEAICYQAEYIYENGTEYNDLSSYSVLDINISVNNKKSVASRKNMSEMAYNSIHKTGLDNLII